MSRLKYMISLVVGDWSNDGHEKRETKVIKSNLSVKKIHEAYENAVKKTGLDLKETVTAEYEDNTISSQHVSLLKEHNIDIQDFVFHEITDSEHADGVILDNAESYTCLWLEFPSIGNLDFKYELVQDNQENVINVGGYGLFS